MSTERPVILVTGSTDGIGRETAIALARAGARVLVHGRDPERVQATVAELGTIRADAALEPLTFELDRLADVRGAGVTLDERGVRIDVLINNAGVLMREPILSADGFEMTFAVNYLAPFALTHALLRSSAGRELKRIINVSSSLHLRGTLKIDDLSFRAESFEPTANYSASKLAGVLFTVELARRLRTRGTVVNAVHPGVVSTKLLTEGLGRRGPNTLAEAAETLVKAAMDAELAETSGVYFNGTHPSPMNAMAENLELTRELYLRSAQLTGVTSLAD